MHDPTKRLSKNGVVPSSVNSTDHLTRDGAVARETDRNIEKSLSSSPGSSSNALDGYKTHRNIGSIDSGFLELSSSAVKDSGNIKPDEISSASSLISPPASQPNYVNPGPLQFFEDMETGSSSSSAPSSTLPDSSSETLQESCVLMNGQSLTKPQKKSELHLNLDVVRRRKAMSSMGKSTSSPTFVTPVETPSSILSFVSAGASPQSCFVNEGPFFTPTYAKMRHFAQSPVRQFKPLVVDRNPFMSPLYAGDDDLRALCPVYLVVSFVFCFSFT